METILEVNNLCTSFDTEQGPLQVVDGVSFSVKKGQTLGLVGESGCGKSVTALSIIGLLPQPYGRITSGNIFFKGTDLTQLPISELYKTRGNRIAMIFQEPMTALNPVHTIGHQISEVYQLHRPEMPPRQRRQAAIDMLNKVGIPEAQLRFDEYPHQLSGGMRQRVMIAMALACEPDILIADEPTTALDVTIQAQILELMKQLQRDHGMTIIFITHDLGVVAQMCDEVVVMYAGRVAEQCSVYELFDAPLHPYSRGLLDAIPKLDSIPQTPLATIEGMVPALQQMPAGCRFNNRCPNASKECKKQPEVSVPQKNHRVYCWHPVTVTN